MQALKLYGTAMWMAVMLAAVFPARAQEIYKVKFKGVCNTVDPGGNEVKQRVDNRFLIQEWAALAGATNIQDLDLVFKRNADGQGGDSIDIINKRTGAFVVSVFPLSFPEKASASTEKSETERRFDYVYNIYQPDFSRGTAILDERTRFKKNGSVSRVITGTMQWYELATDTHPLRVCSGKFNVRGKPLEFE